mgnify:CR=1 FL=1
MESDKAGFISTDEYIATFPEGIQKILQELRATIKASAPDAVEKISYQMPTFALKGNLVHFADWKTISGFIRRRLEFRNLGVNYQFMRAQKGL